MRSRAYIHAVNNLEKLLEKAKEENLLYEEDLTTLSYNIFILKMMPLYTGMERKPNNNEDDQV